MNKYLITDKLAQTTIETSEANLFYNIKELFPEGNQTFHIFLHKRIISSPNTPYNNERFNIKCITLEPVKNKRFTKMANFPVNEFPKTGAKRLHNEWIMVNTKTGENYPFNNLAALARSLKISYRWLYQCVAYAASFKFRHYIITRSSMIEKDFYQIQLNKIL